LKLIASLPEGGDDDESDRTTATLAVVDVVGLGVGL